MTAQTLFDLTGKNVLITGASGAIGGAIASLLHQYGATVALSGTNIASLEKKAAELKERAHIIPCNLSDRDAVGAMIETAEKAMGSVDILINNAGLTRDGLAMRMKDEDWDQVIEVNLTSTFLLIRDVMRGMMKRRTGRIINITSVVGVMGNAGQANYAASKAGLIGMSKSLAQEVASRGITVNCIAPGFIRSAMTDVLNDQQKESILKGIPMNAMGDPADIAAAALYLASNAGHYVTGQTIHVNGGMVMI